MNNPKYKKSRFDSDQSTSTANLNINGKKVMLCLVGSEKGLLYYELLKSGETIYTQHYRRQLIDLSQKLKKKRLE